MKNQGAQPAGAENESCHASQAIQIAEPEHQRDLVLVQQTKHLIRFGPPTGSCLKKTGHPRASKVEKHLVPDKGAEKRHGYYSGQLQITAIGEKSAYDESRVALQKGADEERGIAVIDNELFKIHH